MSNNPLNNKNYINKDFQTIYPELLDLVKKLTYKWDPTISNESDPGVLLIKLNAIIADKNNYNIDKNILECFPDTVTQPENAYKLFNQLGYNMQWYEAASGEVSLTWVSEDLSSSITPYTVPQFTMVSNEDKDLVFTIIDSVPISFKGESSKCKVLQGVVHDYLIGNSKKITPAHLDYRNRLYFPISNIAQNGIFISDIIDEDENFVWSQEKDDIHYWGQVDNLLCQPLSRKCYEFGIDQTNGSCYIQFPSDIVDLMGNGLMIKYIQTEGNSGNIAAGRITNFYNDLVINDRTISKDIYVSNISPISSGKDPETIDEAYVRYKRTLGTFDTLVTLRDYINYIVNDEFQIVSNGIVSDRTNDIQSSYRILEEKNGVNNLKQIVVGSDENTPEMTAYDIRTYFLEYSTISAPSNGYSHEEQIATWKRDYEKSFQFKLGDSDSLLGTSQTIKDIYSDTKSIQHDFQEKYYNRPLLFKNKFNLKLTIIPNQMLTEVQAQEVEKNVYLALYTNLSSSKLTFGEEVSYETIYDICNNADSRIKAIALDNIEYDTYAVIYYDPNKPGIEDLGEIQEVDLTTPGLREILVASQVIGKGTGGTNTVNENLALDIISKNVLGGATPLYEKESSYNFDINQENVEIIEGVYKADTSVDFVFGDLEALKGAFSEPQSLEDNEAIFLYAPNLKEKIKYTTGSKYLYLTTEEYVGEYTEQLPANSDLVLDRGQIIYVFWKNEDSKDSPYLYTKYGEGTILKATTKLVKSKANEDGALQTKLLNSGYEGSGQIFGDLNDDIWNINDSILGTTKTLTIKTLNETKLNESKNDCYWITNDRRTNSTTGKDEYIITFNHADNDLGRYIKTNYCGGQIYVANWGLNVSDENPQNPAGYTVGQDYNLEIGQKIFILEKIPINLKYKKWVEEWKDSTEVDQTVSRYKLIAKLESTDTLTTTINCNGPILDGRDYIIGDTEESLIEHLEKVWSNSDQRNISEGTLSPVTGHPGCKVFDPDDAAKALDAITTEILTDGYRIQVIDNKDNYDTGDILTYEYQLKQNEYFINTDINRSVFNILSKGTTIRLYIPYKPELNLEEPILKPIAVRDSINNNTLADQGLDAFEDSYWYSFSPVGIKDSTGIITTQTGGEMIGIIENESIMLGKDTEIRIRQVPETIFSKEETSDTLIKSDFWEPIYKYIKIAADGIYTGQDGGTWSGPNSNALSHYRIQYKNKTDSDFTDLPHVLDTSLSWNGYSILNMVAGPGLPQKLKPNHYIKLYHDPNNQELTETVLDSYEYLKTDIFMEIAGGEGINLIYKDLNNNDNKINILVYNEVDLNELNANNTGASIIKEDTYYSVAITPGGTLEVNQDFLPEGYNVILPIQVLSGGDSSYFSLIGSKIVGTDEDDTPIYEDQLIHPIGWDLGNNGFNDFNDEDPPVLYYKLDPSYTKLIFIAGTSNGDESTSLQLILKPLFTYKYDKEIVSDSDLEGKVQELDIMHGYNYIYQPKEDFKIDNPLDPKEFFNSNHFYNRYTIPQIASIEIKTMNKRN